ncbi:hypothetical protein UA08_03037 [Talaromyces atroroseus]|uniref:Uncharacterized protein n=1 Tax=Talaromyces atroroseus TaxID=1441469 RepID=A0A225AS42_TALAT|nr:hypothetical protein UA08_03037 [Talaromyces atroroseus]OKL62313.1 hypothetical protein UA08_03037 [Talaromyces atroroseus]
MPREPGHGHGQDVSLTPLPIAAGDEQVAAAISYSNSFIHVSPKQQQQQQYRKQQQYPPSVSSTPLNCYPVPTASSPEARISMSGSSAGSYSISPGVNWNSAPMSSSSSSHPKETHTHTHTHAHAHTHADAPRAEAGLVTESHKDDRAGLSWTADISLSDGRNSRSLHDAPNTVTVYASEDKEREPLREPNAVLVLLLFSTPIPFFSICTAIYTLIALFLVVFTTPLRFCPPTAFFRSTTFSTQLCRLLAPALRNHERLAQSSASSDYQHHASSSPYNNNNNTRSGTTDHFSAIWLIVVLTLAPVLCMGLLLAVWIAAFFWIFAMILGNPDGTEKGDDGRAAVLGVNAWWQTWLNKSRIRRFR